VKKNILFMLGSEWHNASLDPNYKWLVVATYAVLTGSVFGIWWGLT